MKYGIAVIILLVSCGTPVSSSAQELKAMNSNELESRITALEARVVQLETQLKKCLIILNQGNAHMQNEDMHSEDMQNENKTEEKVRDTTIDQVVPLYVLEQLGTNFEIITPTMEDQEVFQTLGLAKYRKQLEADSSISFDGAGGNWRNFIVNQRGYSLSFRDFFGSVKCMIKLPGEDRWRSRETGVKGLQLTDNHFDILK